LCTNGSTLTKDFCDDLIQTGLQNIRVSLDSFDEDINDKNRGLKGVTDTIKKGLTYLSKSYPDFIKIHLASAVINKTFGAGEEMISFAAKINADINFTHLFFIEKGKRGHNADTLKLSEAQLKEYYFEILPKLLEKADNLGVRVDVRPFFSGIRELSNKKKIYELTKNKEKYLPFIKDYAEGLYGKRFFSTKNCKIITNSLDILADGSVVPCCFVGKERAFGNINDESLVSIWHKHVKQLPELPIPFDNICLSCKNYE